MATETYNDKWSITFYNSQELRSLYMNRVLTSVIRPGIYNPNMHLYTVDNANYTPIRLFIGKGTTFIFSNNYEENNNITTKDSYSEIGVTGIVIKYVAKKNFSVDIGNSSYFEKFLGSDKSTTFPKALKKYKLLATTRYNQDEDTGDRILFNFYSYSTDKGEAYKGSYYSMLSNANDDLVPPVGRFISNTAYSGNVSKLMFLEVGNLISNLAESDDKNHINATYMASSKVSENWIYNYTFTGRGLYEYRNSQNGNGIKSPSVIADCNLKGFYLDLMPTMIRESLYTNSVVPSEVFQKEYPSTANKLYWSIGGASDNSDSIFGNSFIDDLNSQVTQGVDSYVATIDFAYMLVPSKTACAITETWSFDTTDGILRFKDKNGTILSDMPVCKKVRFSFSCTKAFYDMLKGNVNSNIFKSSEDEISYNKDYVLPLDVSSKCRDILIKYVENNNLVMRLIDTMRFTGLGFDGTDRDAIVPVALVFRAFYKKKDSTTFEPSDRLSNADGTTFHPMHLVDLIGLRNESYKVNYIDSLTDGVDKITILR